MRRNQVSEKDKGGLRKGEEDSRCEEVKFSADTVSEEFDTSLSVSLKDCLYSIDLLVHAELRVGKLVF